MTASNSPEISQRLTLENRKRLFLNAVKDVISFDENGAILLTDYGNAIIDGEGLRVIKLGIDGGSIEIEGKLNGFFFSDAKKQKKKLFGQ